MNKLLESIGIAIMALLFIAVFPVTILIITIILIYLGMNSAIALFVGAIISLFIIITIEVYRLI